MAVKNSPRDVYKRQMQEMVYVGSKKLIGEVISISSERTTIQVYETTTGLRVGEETVSYTHLDVYKRQHQYERGSLDAICGHQ